MRKVYYVSQGRTANVHLENIEKVCKAGVRFVQLRMKGVTEQEYVATAMKAVELVHSYGGKLIVNDNTRVAYVANADGVHLGQKDMSPIAARRLLPDKIIGGTANTSEQATRLIEQGVDYLGVGPYRFTETKEYLSPILGLDGYKKIQEKLKEQRNVPLYAIGGIEVKDLLPLLELGVSGVAISRMLTRMQSEEITELLDVLQNLDKNE